MRRAVARGRMVPQSLSTDPRYGRLSLKAQVLYPLMWINADDQGRLAGDPDEIKYATCPSVREIAADDIPALLQEMETRSLIKVYTTSRTKATQMLDWWGVQKLQWAYPSEYPPPEGWKDSLRYHPTPKEIITENWPPPSRLLNEVLPSELPSKPASKPASALPSTLQSDKESSKEITENEEEKEGGRGRGRLPSALGSTDRPSPVVDSYNEILKRLTECFKVRWGKVPADRPNEIIRREPTAKESAQLRDLAQELCVAGGCPLKYIDQAFDEAAGQPAQKMKISYVRAILLDWLGVKRERRESGRSPPD